jgi:hypothetical protein
MPHSNLTFIRFAQDVTALWEAIIKLNVRLQDKQPNPDGTFPIDSIDGKALDGIINALDGLSVLANTKDSRVPEAIRAFAKLTLSELDGEMPIGMDKCFAAYRATSHSAVPSIEDVLALPLMSKPTSHIRQIGRQTLLISHRGRDAGPDSGWDDIPL